MAVAPPALDRDRAQRLVATTASTAWSLLAAYLELRGGLRGGPDADRLGGGGPGACPGVLRTLLPPVSWLRARWPGRPRQRASPPGLPTDRRQIAA